MNRDCSAFRPARQGGAGQHWKLKRLHWHVGDVAKCFGDFVQGGCCASLLHRHDVRTGIAAGMVLREHFATASGALRVELLCVVFVCYWKWAPARILNYVLRHQGELLAAADARGRAALYERAWEEAMSFVRPDEFTVVCNRLEATVELLPRSEKPREGRRIAPDFFCYHPAMNPAKRRPAADEFDILMEDLRGDRLEPATVALAEKIAAASGATATSGASYVACEPLLRKVQLWKGARYSRTTFLRWLFRAEDVPRSLSDEDWALLAGMGSGAEKGVQAAGDIEYEGALEVCTLISENLWANSGAEYEIDDLICFLCLSQNGNERIQGGAMPRPAPPVTVAGDLGYVHTEVPARARSNLPQAGCSSGPAGAADSPAASGAAPSAAAGCPSPDGSSGVVVGAAAADREGVYDGVKVHFLRHTPSIKTPIGSPSSGGGSSSGLHAAGDDHQAAADREGVCGDGGVKTPIGSPSPGGGSSGLQAAADDHQAAAEVDAPAGSPADPASHCKRCRRWRSGVLEVANRGGYLELQPWRVVWERCLHCILDFLPFVAQARFSRSSRCEELQCRTVVWGWGRQIWEAVAGRLQFAFIADVPHSALTASGVSHGDRYRALASCMDICDHLAPGPLPAADVPLACLAILRCALKLSLNRDHVEAIGEHFRHGGCLHRPGVGNVEKVILRRIAQHCDSGDMRLILPP